MIIAETLGLSDAKLMAQVIHQNLMKLDLRQQCMMMDDI